MQSFDNVPVEDINYLLSSNNLPLTDNKYLTAWNFIINNPNINVPVSIADYVIAYNIQKSNISTITLYDIIKSNYKIQNLSSERTIRILKYLNKLDETDPFINLPNEIVAKILSELDCEQILTLCKISKRFGNICRYYKNTLFDRFLSEKGFTIREYKPEIICKALNFNKRIADCGEYEVDDETYYLYTNITSDGRVIGSLILGDDFINFEIEGIKNIISVVYNPNNHYLLFLDSFGEVYKSETILDDHIIESLKNPKHIFNLKNIIQIVTDNDNPAFLDIYGNVFIYDKFIIINNIIEMFVDEDSFVFLTSDGDVYGIGSNERDKFKLSFPIIIGEPPYLNKVIRSLNSPTKLGSFKNIKNVLMRSEYLVTINDDNNLTMTGAMETNYSLYFIKNIVKIEEKDQNFYILNNGGILYKFHFLTPDDIKEFLDVKDFEVDKYYLTMLTNSGEIEIYLDDIDKSFGLEIKGNIILLDTRHILINNVLYYLHVDINNDKITLTKIS